MSDYISREAAIEAVREKLGCETCNGSNVGIICTFCNVGEAILMIKNIPAADVEPVRHGRWKPLFESEITGWNPAFAGCDPIGAYVCSCCNSEATYTCDDEFDLSNYCPNCGAKMCLEDEENDKQTVFQGEQTVYI